MPNRLWLNINFRHARLSTGDGAKHNTVSFADTPKIQHYNTPPPFDAEDINTNVTVESVHEGLAKVTTPRKTAVVPAEGPSQREDIDIEDEEQGLFIDLMENLIYLSGAKVSGKPGQVVRSRTHLYLFQQVNVLELDEFFILWNHTLNTRRRCVKRYIMVLQEKFKIIYVGQNSVYKGSFQLTRNSAEAGRHSAGEDCASPQST
jgi:hypothetical protein